MKRSLLLAATLLAGRAYAQPITGPYISLGAGVDYLQDEKLRRSSFFQGQKLKFDPAGAVGVAAAGYGFGNGFRVEVEGDYRYNQFHDLHRTFFPAVAGGHQENYGGMLNGYFDLDVGSPYVYPYFGVGAGYSETRLTRLGVFVPAAGFSSKSDGTLGAFAYQAMFGLSFPVSFVPGLSMTAEYRFFSVVENGHFRETDQTVGPEGVSTSQGRTAFRHDYNHSAMIGLKYALFTPAPPPPPAQVHELSSDPAPGPARTYLVFFDWDRADLSARARQIVAEAAQASTHVQSTRIQVNGYTDLSGTAAYNQKLSIRRAQSVEAELVRDGVNRTAITIHGYGESSPLVQTAKGVREPQNRRVEIIL